MTILTTIQNVAAMISLNIPSTVFSSSEREHVELQVLANACASHIARDYEWQALKSRATIMGNGSDVAFDFPPDYDRMLKDGALWSNRLQAPLTHIISTDYWLELDIRQFVAVTGAWTIFADRIHIRPAPSPGEHISFHYMSDTWARDENGALKTVFTKDSDSFRLSEELLELHLIWNWKSRKKLPYAQEKDDYEDAKEKLIGADKGARMLRVGRGRMPRGTDIAYPVSIVP